ncbi:hypothetical protein LS73_008870 [Helicobacter muridarum]|uniref:Uncharacterized protein n=1 Tax=Helicobacter muridarum TaxID=216 RepID=A0A099TWD8_9HELI|nr:hypothetical protein [Helicobacter muridarum]TLD98476.1 hypothetical protein LS73_008870 [Helicobacter muridarum]STQ85576.1 Uncharacterised protein [Helicobacter muridarum]
MSKTLRIVGNKYFLIGFVLLYLFGVVILADFGIIDDHTLVGTLLTNNYIPLTHHIMINIGRFYPLSGMDLNILSFLFSPNALVFYVFNALCIVLIILALHYVLSTVSSHVLDSINIDVNRANLSFVVSFCIVLLLITPAFIQSYLRLFVPERLEFLFLVLFFACYIYILCNEYTSDFKARYRSYIILLFGIFFANASLYYKETAFAFLGAFGFCHLVIYIFSTKQAQYSKSNIANELITQGSSKLRNIKLIIFDIALIISSLIWLLMYYFIVITQKDTTYLYGMDSSQSSKAISKVFFVFWKIFLNETFLVVSIFVGFGLCLFIWIKSRAINALLISMILACFVFIAEYIAIGIFPANHYMLPCYVFGLPLICIWILLCFRLVFCKWLFIVCMLYFLLATLPSSLLLFGHYKLVPRNFQECVRFLSDYTIRNDYTKIYLKDINPESGVEIYVSFDKWLRFHGGLNFDVDSLFNNEFSPNKDDIIVVPYAHKTNIFELLSASDKYALLYASSYNIDIPNLSLRSLIRYIKSKARGEDNKNVGQFSDYNFYIFKVLK